MLNNTIGYSSILLSTSVNSKGVIIFFSFLNGSISEEKSYKLYVINGSDHLNSEYPVVCYFTLTLGGTSLFIHNIII